VASLRSSASGQTLRVQGLSELIRDLGKADKDAKREVVNGLKKVAEIVQDEAARTIGRKGLYDTGELYRKMMSRGALSVTQQAVSVKSTAKRGGFLYGGVYEFGGRSHSLKRKGPGRTAVKNRTKQGAKLAASGAATGSFGEYGPRAFLWPAAEAKKAETERAMEHWLDTFLSQHNL
jgi:hypothetical protein